MKWWTWPLTACALLLASGAIAKCEPKPGLNTFFSDGWGIDADNHRLQRQTTLTRNNVQSLRLAWSYGLANKKPRMWPLATEDTLFIGDTGRGIVALDRNSGCERWMHSQPGEIASAILHLKIGTRTALLYLERTSGVYAIDATDGTPIWHAEVNDQPLPLYSGTPFIAGNVVYVPISSVEVALAMNPIYGCCRTSGGMAAFNAATGKKLWFRRTISSPARQVGRHWRFVKEYGPSGAPAWAAPLYNAKRGLIYFGTGENYSRPTTNTSDAIFALAGMTGALKWVHQFTTNDSYNTSCDVPFDHPNCRRPKGPDLDFGAPPVMVHLADNRDVLVVGQKSADIYGLDPDNGAILWKNRLGRGGALGGVHWGIAANEDAGLVFVPISDIEDASHATRGSRPGLYALDAATGKIRWQHARTSRCAERNCYGGISAAITATPDLIAAESFDGILEIYDAINGRLLWSDDSWKHYATVNGVPASGGTYDAHGPMIAGDQIIVTSGYDSFFQKPGNALLVYQLQKVTP